MTAITKYNSLEVLKQKCIPRNTGGQKSETKVAGLVSSWPLSFACRWPPYHFALALRLGHVPLMCLCVSEFSLLMRTPVRWE